MLNGKNIVLGVSGGISCYKMCEVVSRLKKLNANIDVIMTGSATEFVAPLTFETLSKNRVVTDMFDRSFKCEVEHISLAKKADLFLIAPATANIIAKVAHGIADDMLSTTVLATRAKTVLVPSMNTGMYENAATQENLAILSKRGYHIFEPVTGLLACGDVGKGKLPEPEAIVREVVRLLTLPQDFAGKRVLVTCGGTSENLDGVRYITNHSSGKMGIELAKAFYERGAEVTLIAGNISVDIPGGITVEKVVTTCDMYQAVMAKAPNADIIVKAAAPADYRPETVSTQKIKSDTLRLDLVKNPDIARAVGKMKGNRILVVFCAETENLLENAKKKLVSKNADLIIANDVTQEGAGFNADTNIVTIMDKNGGTEAFDKLNKSTLSHIILDKIALYQNNGGKK